MKNLYLVGYMGTGKTTVSLKLAELLGCQVLDTDEMIVRENGMTIPEIFEKFGQEGFRDREAEMFRRLAEGGDKQTDVSDSAHAADRASYENSDMLIISCGGGAVLREENRANMKKSGTVIWLTAEPQTVYDRIHTDKNRPLLADNMTAAYIAGMMSERRDAYSSAADYAVATDGKDTEKICAEIREILMKAEKN